MTSSAVFLPVLRLGSRLFVVGCGPRIALNERTDKNVAFFWTSGRGDKNTLPKLKDSNIERLPVEVVELAGKVKDELGFKVHWTLPDYLQRSARHLASKTDLDQAVAVGKAAVQFALKGQNATMPVIVQKAARSVLGEPVRTVREAGV